MKISLLNLLILASLNSVSQSMMPTSPIKMLSTIEDQQQLMSLHTDGVAFFWDLNTNSLKDTLKLLMDPPAYEYHFRYDTISKLSYLSTFTRQEHWLKFDTVKSRYSPIYSGFLRVRPIDTTRSSVFLAANNYSQSTVSMYSSEAGSFELSFPSVEFSKTISLIELSTDHQLIAVLFQDGSVEIRHSEDFTLKRSIAGNGNSIQMFKWLDNQNISLLRKEGYYNGSSVEKINLNSGESVNVGRDAGGDDIIDFDYAAKSGELAILYAGGKKINFYDNTNKLIGKFYIRDPDNSLKWTSISYHPSQNVLYLGGSFYYVEKPILVKWDLDKGSITGIVNEYDQEIQVADLLEKDPLKKIRFESGVVSGPSEIPANIDLDPALKQYTYRKSDSIVFGSISSDSVRYLSKIKYPVLNEYGNLYFTTFSLDYLISEEDQIYLVGEFGESKFILRFDTSFKLLEAIPFSFENSFMFRAYNPEDKLLIVEEIDGNSRREDIYSINIQTGEVDKLDKSERRQHAYQFFALEMYDITEPFDFYHLRYLPVSKDAIFLIGYDEAALYNVHKKELTWRTPFEHDLINYESMSYTADSLVHFLSTDQKSNERIIYTIGMKQGQLLGFQTIEAEGSDYWLSGDSLLWVQNESEFTQIDLKTIPITQSNQQLETTEKNFLDSIMNQYEQPFDSTKLTSLQVYYKIFDEELKTFTFDDVKEISNLRHEAGDIFDFSVQDSSLFLEGDNGTFQYSLNGFKLISKEYDRIPIFTQSGNHYFVNNRLFQTNGNIQLRIIKLSDISFYNPIPTYVESEVLLTDNGLLALYNLADRSYSYTYPVGNISSPIISHDKSRVLFRKRVEKNISVMWLDLMNPNGIDSLTVNVKSGDYFKSLHFLSKSSNEVLLEFNNRIELLDLNDGMSNIILSIDENYYLEEMYQYNDLIFILTSKNPSSANEYGEAKFFASLPAEKLSVLDLKGRSYKTFNVELSKGLKDPLFEDLKISDKIEYEKIESSPESASSQLGIKLQREVEIDDLVFSDLGNYFITYSTLDPYFVLWDARSLRQIREFYCDDCESFQYSESRKEIAYYSRTGYPYSLVILNSETNAIKKRIEIDEGSLVGLDLNNQVYYTSDPFEDNYGLKVHDFSSSEVVFTYPQDVDRVKVMKEGIVGIEGNELLIFDEKKRKPYASIKINNKADFLYSYEVSGDRKYVLLHYPIESSKSGLGDHPWELKSTVDDKIIAQGKVPFGTPRPVFSEDGKSIYYIDIADSVYYLNNDSSTAYSLYSLYEEDIISGLKDELYTFNSYSGVGILNVNKVTGEILFSVGPRFYTYNKQFNRVERNTVDNIPEEYTSYQSFNNGKNGLIRNDNAIHIIDFQNPRNYRKFMTQATSRIQLIGDTKWIAEDSTRYWEDEKDYKVTYVIYDAKKPGDEKELVLKNAILSRTFQINPSSELLLITYTAKDQYEVVLYDREGSMERIGVEEFIYDDESNLTEDGKYFIARLSKGIHVYSLQGEKKLIRKLDDALNLIPTQKENLFVLEKSVNNYGREYFLYDLAKDVIIRKIGKAPYLGSYRIALSKGDQYLYALSSEYYVRFPLFAKNELEIARRHEYNYVLDFYRENDRLVVVKYNEVIFLNELFEEEFKVISGKESGVTLQLPTGAYFILAGGAPRFLNFVRNNRGYPFDQFDLYYNRPDLVLAKTGNVDQNLINAYYDAYVKRIKRKGLDPQDISTLSNTPVVEISNPGDLPSITDKPSIDLSLIASDSIDYIKSFHIWVNNNPVLGSGGWVVPDKKKNKIRFSYELPLSVGLNIVQVGCTNEAGVESIRETIEIEYKPDNPKKSNLYLAIISVSDYEDDQYDLDFAAKDGEDIIKTFKSLENESLDSVYVKALFDGAANRENILALKEWLQTSSIDDNVIVFVSGHGLLDEEFEWWFATHNIDFTNPALAGVNYLEIESLLDSIPARNKLLLMDACHSGEVDREATSSSDDDSEGTLLTQNFNNTKGTSVVSSRKLKFEDSFSLMQELFVNLSRGSGSHVISAAAGDSYAYEYGEYRNGVFTYAIRTGLNEGKADADGDLLVTISELNEYVREEVTRITNGRQVPNNRQINLENDFIIWQIRDKE